MDLTVVQVAFFFEDIIRKPEKRIKPLICNVFGEDYIEQKHDELVGINMPIDIPLIQMTYNRFFTWNINIAQSRLDIFAELPVQKNGDIQSELISEVSATIKKVINQLLSKIDINRLGVVGKFFEIKDNPTKLISQKLFNEKYNNSVELNFKVNNQELFENLVLNNIIQIGEATMNTVDRNTKKQTPNTGVMLIRDINNKVDEDEILEEETVYKLLDFACNSFTRAEIEKVW